MIWNHELQSSIECPAQAHEREHGRGSTDGSLQIVTTEEFLRRSRPSCPCQRVRNGTYESGGAFRGISRTPICS